MALVNLTRKERFNQKRDISVFTAVLNVDDMPTSGDVYQLFRLPSESLVTEAAIQIITANDAGTTATADVGFNGGDTLIDGADLSAAAGSSEDGGVNAAVPVLKETGDIVTITPAYDGTAPTAGKILVRVEYVEYMKITGELTNFVAE